GRQGQRKNAVPARRLDPREGGATAMNVIFFSRRRGRARHLNLSHPVTLTIVSILGLGLLASTLALGVQLGQRSMERMALLNPGLTLLAEQEQVAALRSQLQDRV